MNYGMDNQTDAPNGSAVDTTSSETGPLDQTPPLRSNVPNRAFGMYLTMAIVWGFAISYFGREFTIRPPWIVFVGVVLFSIPVILSSLYLVTTRKIRNLAVYDRGGCLYRIFSGRIGWTLLWSVWAAISTLFVLLQFHTYTSWEWFGFFLVVPLFWIVYQVARNLLTGEIKPYLASATAIRTARRVTPILATLAYFAVVYVFVDPPHHQTLTEAIEYARKDHLLPTGSALIFELAHYQAYYDGAKYFALGQLRGDQIIWALLLVSFGGYLIFFSASTMLSCFAIPLREYRRVFSPLSDAETPPRMTGWNIGLTSAIFSFVVLFILLPTFTTIEQVIREDNEFFEAVREKADLSVVQIDDTYFRRGTLDELRDAQVEALRKMDHLLPALDRELDRAFDAMESNVDSFLDWYYSLKAEYLRTLNLLAGNFEDYLAEQLTTHLQLGDPFEGFETKVAEAMELQREIQEAYIRDAQSILDRNRVEPTDDVNLVVLQRVALPEMLTLPQHKDMVAIEKRLGLSGGAGVIAAAATKKIIAKIAAKGTFKIAGTVLTKMVAGKAVAGLGGAAGGAAAGAAVGSVIPGIGTAIGATIGGSVGALATGVAVDKGLLILEEYVSREQFRKDLVDAIRETRVAF